MPRKIHLIAGLLATLTIATLFLPTLGGSGGLRVSHFP
jgi:hypothetical protein